MFTTPAMQRMLMWNVPVTLAAMRNHAPPPTNVTTLVSLNITVLSVVHSARASKDAPSTVLPVVLRSHQGASLSVEAQHPASSSVASQPSTDKAGEVVKARDPKQETTITTAPTTLDHMPEAPTVPQDLNSELVDESSAPTFALDDIIGEAISPVTENLTTTNTTCNDATTMSPEEDTPLITTSATEPTPTPGATHIPVQLPEPEEEKLPALVDSQQPEIPSGKELGAIDAASLAGSSTASEDGDDDTRDHVLAIKVKPLLEHAAPLPSPIPETNGTEPLFSMDLMSDVDDSEYGWSSVYASSECTEPESADSLDTGRSRRRSRLPRPREGAVQPELQPCLRRNNRSATSLAGLELKARVESPARPRGDVTSRLYNPSYHQERDSKFAQLREQRELEQCTFRPSTNGKPPATRRRRHRMSI
ncbi:hypothetical protein ACHHYP_16598 [Achlya hypogyna]|uniref:Uncharacterized protein n=1 Tax=Achlya hypogyna TaxID=1202772 RepID=A0A1V9Y676_ACHHY|nr:hypothetical protein ACHHYP_16598 [Achlya hypogyna]